MSSDNSRLADLGLITAQEISVHIAASLAGMLSVLSQHRRNIIGTAVNLPVSDLGEILEQAVRIIQGLSRTKKPSKAQSCTIIMAVFMAIVSVVVAVIVALLPIAASGFTFANALIGTVISSVVLPLNAAGCLLVYFLKVAARSGRPLAGEGAAIMSQVMSVLRSYANANLTDSMTARDKALKEIRRLLERLERSIPEVHKIEGPFQGDLRELLRSSQMLNLILTQLIENLRFERSIPQGELQAVVRHLRRLRSAMAKAHGNLRPATQNRQT